MESLNGENIKAKFGISKSNFANTKWDEAGTGWEQWTKHRPLFHNKKIIIIQRHPELFQEAQGLLSLR